MDRVHQSEPLEWVTLQAIAEFLQRVYNPFQGFWLVNVTAFIWFAIRFHVAKIPQSPVSILGHPVLGQIILKDRCRSAVMENTRHTRLLSCTKPINCSTFLATVASRHVGGGLVSRPNPSDSPDLIWSAQSRPPPARPQSFLSIFVNRVPSNGEPGVQIGAERQSFSEHEAQKGSVRGVR